MFMKRDFLKEGSHSWDLVHEYHRCEKCRKIFEDRTHYEYRLGDYVKELECPSCEHQYTVHARKRESLGPLFGR